jgi:prephenate dehydrogenase
MPSASEKKMRSNQKITIVGTGCIGASIGLALRASQDAPHLRIVGHDRDHGVARRALKLGAFDDVSFNLDLALRDAQLVIVAVPLSALRETLDDIGRLITAEPGAAARGGIVITDTAPLKRPAHEWAASLPADVHYVGGDPFLAPGMGGWEPLRGLTSASAELFRDAVYAVTPRASDHPSAVRTVHNLALVLGATPLLMDPEEHDAVSLMARTVPALIAGGVFAATAEQPGWEEVRRAAGREFATATAGVVSDVASQRMAALLGRETVLRGLDAVLEQLGALRDTVASGEAEALEAALGSANEGRARWILQSHARSWQMGQETPEQRGLFNLTIQTILGEGLAGKSGQGSAGEPEQKRR